MGTVQGDIFAGLFPRSELSIAITNARYLAADATTLYVATARPGVIQVESVHFVPKASFAVSVSVALNNGEQPVGIMELNDSIYVTVRDQLNVDSLTFIRIVKATQVITRVATTVPGADITGRLWTDGTWIYATGRFGAGVGQSLVRCAVDMSAWSEVQNPGFNFLGGLQIDTAVGKVFAFSTAGAGSPAMSVLDTAGFAFDPNVTWAGFAGQVFNQASAGPIDSTFQWACIAMPVSTPSKRNRNTGVVSQVAWPVTAPVSFARFPGSWTQDNDNVYAVLGNASDTPAIASRIVQIDKTTTVLTVTRVFAAALFRCGNAMVMDTDYFYTITLSGAAGLASRLARWIR